MDAAMLMVALCQQFGWTYDQYMQQPNWFITLIREKLVRDRKEEELAAKRTHRGR